MGHNTLTTKKMMNCHGHSATSRATTNCHNYLLILKQELLLPFSWELPKIDHLGKCGKCMIFMTFVIFVFYDVIVLPSAGFAQSDTYTFFVSALNQITTSLIHLQ